MRSIKLYPKLWDEVKRDIAKKHLQGKQWNARMSQLAVREYKKEAGKKYSDPNPYLNFNFQPLSNRMAQWTAEDWQFVDDDPKGRMLPKDVIKKLPRTLRRSTNTKKKLSNKQRVGYSNPIKKILKQEDVF